MKRADRSVQIQRLTIDLEKHRHIARIQSQQPLALVKKHPVFAVVISALALGTATRIVGATPVSTAIKILGIPLLRQLVSSALLMIRQTQQQ